MTGFE
jgi:hypothetical protein